MPAAATPVSRRCARCSATPRCVIPSTPSSSPQVLAIPQKRYDKARRCRSWNPPRSSALLAAPDLTRWEGRRDRALIALAAQTGLRLAELTGLTCGDVQLGAGAHVRCTGKGRKQRCVPLTPATAAILRVWLQRTRRPARRPAVPHPHRPAAQRRRGRSAASRSTTRHAAQHCPSLASQETSPRTCSGTPPPWPCSAKASTSPSSRSGSATPTSAPPSLPARRHDHQGTSARPRYTAVRQTRTLPATRPPARLPGEPVIIPAAQAPGHARSPPASTALPAPISDRDNPELGISRSACSRRTGTPAPHLARCQWRDAGSG